jgi:hypothetical protein
VGGVASAHVAPSPIGTRDALRAAGRLAARVNLDDACRVPDLQSCTRLELLGVVPASKAWETLDLLAQLSRDPCLEGRTRR